MQNCSRRDESRRFTVDAKFNAVTLLGCHPVRQLTVSLLFFRVKKLTTSNSDSNPQPWPINSNTNTYPYTSTNPNPNPRYLTLTLLRHAGYETPGYEKVRVRNVWNHKISMYINFSFARQL